MTDKDNIKIMEKLTHKLHQELFEVFGSFWKKNKGISQEYQFQINSAVLSSIIARAVSAMFKLESSTHTKNKYIDMIGENAKDKLQKFEFLLKAGIGG